MNFFIYIFSFFIFISLFFYNSKIVYATTELDVIYPDNVEIIYNDIKSSDPQPCAGPSCTKTCVCTVADPTTNFLVKKEVVLLHSDGREMTNFWRIRETTARNKFYSAYAIVNFNIGQDKCFFRIDKEVEPIGPLSGERYVDFENGFALKCVMGVDPGCLNVQGGLKEINMGSCKVVAREATKKCCCQIVEGGELTRKSSCRLAEGFGNDQYLCENVTDKSLGAVTVFPLPAAGDCSSLEESSTEYVPGKQDLGGITVAKLQADAAAKLNPLKFTGLTNLIGRLAKLMPMYMGAIAMVMYIWAGFLWMTASGTAEKTTKAKAIIVWTSLGVIAMLASYILVSFVFSSVLQINL